VQVLDSGNLPARSFMFAVAGTSVVAPSLLVPKLQLGNAVCEAPASGVKSSWNLQGEGSQAGTLAVIHKSVRVEIFRGIRLYTIVTGKRSLTPRRKGAKKSDFLCVLA